MQSHNPSDEACCPDLLSGSPEQRELHDMFLTPGRTFDLEALSPATLARLPEIREAEQERAKTDWPNLCKYIARNKAVLAGGVSPEVVFIGDSITENWVHADPDFFGDNRAGRGIGGQTSAQILLRMYPDVVALRPRAVHILAGSNDVAGNNGPVSDDSIVDNIRAMIDIAQANRIEVILASLTPARSFFWRPDLAPADRIQTLNIRLQALAAERGAVWLNYHPRLADSLGGLSERMGNDGVHPNRDGYAAMRTVAEPQLKLALS